jgi:hypothetical protein
MHKLLHNMGCTFDKRKETAASKNEAALCCGVFPFSSLGSPYKNELYSQTENHG